MQDNFFDLENRLAKRIMASLGISDPTPQPRPQARQRQSAKVAVMALRDLSPHTRYHAMEMGFADILQSNLSVFEDVQLIERQNLFSILNIDRIGL